MKPCEADLIAAYEYLASVEPCKSWNLPPSSAIDFEITRSQMLQGEYEPDPHTIRASSYCCKTQQDVLETVAHEMVHLHLEKAGGFNHANHCPKFKGAARKICKQFGWNLEEF